MTLTIELPDQVSRPLTERYGDLPRHLLETLAAEGYRSRAITEYQVKVMLAYQTRMQVHEFLKKRRVPLNYGVDEFRKDLAELRNRP